MVPFLAFVALNPKFTCKITFLRISAFIFLFTFISFFFFNKYFFFNYFTVWPTSTTLRGSNKTIKFLWFFCLSRFLLSLFKDFIGFSHFFAGAVFLFWLVFPSFSFPSFPTNVFLPLLSFLRFSVRLYLSYVLEDPSACRTIFDFSLYLGISKLSWQ